MRQKSTSPVIPEFPVVFINRRNWSAWASLHVNWHSISNLWKDRWKDFQSHVRRILCYSGVFLLLEYFNIRMLYYQNRVNHLLLAFIQGVSSLNVKTSGAYSWILEKIYRKKRRRKHFNFSHLFDSDRFDSVTEKLNRGSSAPNIARTYSSYNRFHVFK